MQRYTDSQCTNFLRRCSVTIDCNVTFCAVKQRNSSAKSFVFYLFCFVSICARLENPWYARHMLTNSTRYVHLLCIQMYAFLLLFLCRETITVYSRKWRKRCNYKHTDNMIIAWRYHSQQSTTMQIKNRIHYTQRQNIQLHWDFLSATPKQNNNKWIIRHILNEIVATKNETRLHCSQSAKSARRNISTSHFQKTYTIFVGRKYKTFVSPFGIYLMEATYLWISKTERNKIQFKFETINTCIFG